MYVLSDGNFTFADMLRDAEREPIGALVGKKIETPGGLLPIVSDVFYEDSAGIRARYVKVADPFQEGAVA